MEGAFWTRPSPADPPFAAPGTRVEPGDTVGLIEVMKTFTPVRAQRGGVVVSWRVADGAPVSPGEVIGWLDPRASSDD